MEYTNRIFRVMGTIPLPDAAAAAAHQEQSVQLNKDAQVLSKLVYTQDLMNLKAELATLETELTSNAVAASETIQATISNLNSVIDYTLSKI
jgi:hypothetical protein